MVISEPFGTLTDGREVTRYRLTNGKGESVELLDYGAMIYAVNVLDKNGALGDVVLGAKDAAGLEKCKYNGSTIGRVANRIRDGRYAIDGREYQLELGPRGEFLHGGRGNYARRIFDAEVSETDNAVTFRLCDDIDVGYGCTVQAAVRYSFSDDSRLTMEYEMTAGGDTVINPTNHTYFDVTAGGADIRDCRLRINAAYFAEREAGVPNGGRVSVKGTPADFTRKRPIRDAMADDNGYFSGEPMYDEFYILDDEGFALAAELTAPDGRTMRIYTDMPSLVLFSTGTRGDQEGKNGRINGGWCFTCLEPGFVPNAANCPEYVSNVFRKGETLRARTVYEFSPEE